MNVPVTRAAEGFARRAFTVPDLHKMRLAGVLGEDERFELIEGEIVPMSPKGNQHEVVKSALNRIFAKHAPDELRLAVETSVYLSLTSMVEPDLCLYPKRILPEDLKGFEILLAIEVAGSSLGYDRGLKAKIYAQHGVRELWVVDAASRVTWIHKDPHFDGSWGSVEEQAASSELVTAAAPSVTIRMSDLD